MKESQIGIVTCGSMHHQVREITQDLPGNYRIYPLMPSCTFTLSIGLFRHHLDKSVRENDFTILAYGICHPQLLELISEYGEKVVRLEGSNCWEMFLGAEGYKEALNKQYWTQNKPFLTKWSEETYLGFGINSLSGQLLREDGNIKIQFLQDESDWLEPRMVYQFADDAGLQYKIRAINKTFLKNLILNSAQSQVSVLRKKNLINPRESIEKPEMEAVIENLDEIIYRMDVHRKEMIFVSTQVERLLGYSREEFINMANENGKSSLYYHEDRNRVINERYRYLVRCSTKGVEDCYENEYRIMHQQGQPIWVRESMYPCYSEDGTIKYFVGRIEDITRRKNAEDELKNHYSSETILRHELEEQMQRRNEFTKALIHELKTPLTLILASSDHLERNITEKSQRKLAKKISQGATTLNKRINDLMDLARGETGSLRLSVCSIDLAHLVNSTVEIMSPEIEGAGHSINVNIPSHVPPVQADEDRIQQVLFNIIDNAIKYTPKGTSIEISIYSNNTDVNVVIKDNGPGISQKTLSHLFDGYFRQAIIRENYGGLGIGLSLSKTLIELHRGKIWVSSKEGEGSTFKFSLPQNQALVKREAS